jgi:hypothetical protein
MTTTVTLDADITTQLQAESRRSGRPFEKLVNEFLRAAWAQRKALQLAGFAAERSPADAQPGNHEAS